MPVKPGTWCARCLRAHNERCPKLEAWVKPVHKQSGRGGRPWQRLRERIFERDEYLCQICLRKGITKVVTLHGALAGVCDHVIPKAEGGTDDESNLQTICKCCDKIKTHEESMRGRGWVKTLQPP